MKKLFQVRFSKKELRRGKRIMAGIMLPIMIFQMTSMNFLAMEMMQARADDAVVTADAPKVEAPKEEAPKVETPKVEVNDVAPVVIPEVKADVPKVEEKIVENPKEEIVPVVSATTKPVEGIITPEAASTTLTDTSVVAKGIWSVDSKKATTNDAVELNKEYKFPGNEDVVVKFTDLPENPGKLSIKEIALTDEQISSLGAFSDKAYDITSDMEDGTFKYELSLPKPKSEKNVEVKFAEDVDGLEDADSVPNEDFDVKSEEVNAILDHFTSQTPPSKTVA